LSKDVEILVVCPNLVEDVLRVIPLIEHSFDLVLSPV
jgi:hypothetical protein